LNRNGIPTCDLYPPLHSLNCFREVKLKKGIKYNKANWGGEKSNDKYFPVVSDIYSRSIQLPHEVLLATKDELDFIAKVMYSIKEKVSNL
jgi:hypothetical protein